MQTPLSRRLVLGLLLVLASTLVLSSGCAQGLVTLAYLINGNDAAADFKGLKDKRVVVVCRPLVALQYRDQVVARDIAHEVGRLLQENLKKKIQLVDARKVDEWIDENTWDDYVEVGKALKADLVIGIDLQEFGIHSGQTVYQGKAAACVQVYNCEDGKVLYEKNLPHLLYPPNRGIETSEMQESQFRQRFVKVLADNLARHFYSHDRHADLGLGSEDFD